MILWVAYQPTKQYVQFFFWLCAFAESQVLEACLDSEWLQIEILGFGFQDLHGTPR
jgi:hypothetical protein